MFKVINSANDYIPDPPAEGPNDWMEPQDVADVDGNISVTINDTVTIEDATSGSLTFKSEDKDGNPIWIQPSNVDIIEDSSELDIENYVNNQFKDVDDLYDVLEYVCDVVHSAIRHNYPRESSISGQQFVIKNLTLEVPFAITGIEDVADYSIGTMEEGPFNDPEYVFDYATIEILTNNKQQDIRKAEEAISLVR